MTTAPEDQESPRVSKSPDAADFSTSYWKEIRLGHSRPEIYIAVLAAYLLLLLPAGADRLDFKTVTGWLWGLAAACAVVLSVATAAHAAKRLSRREFLDALRAETAGAAYDRFSTLVSAAYRRELLRALVEPALAAALLAPLCLAIGYGLFALEFKPAVGRSFGVWLWLDAVGSGIVSAMVAAWAAHALASRASSATLAPWAARALRSRFFPPLAALAALAGRYAAAAGIWTVLDLNGASPAPVDLLFWDLLLCAATIGLLLRIGPGRLRWHLIKDAGQADARDTEADRQRALGLDISFWAIFRWKLFRDPLFRAERRSFWTGRRLAVMWILMVIYGAVGPLANHIFINSLRSYWLYAWPASAAWQIFNNLPIWIAPAMFAASLARDRQTGALDDIGITPVAPLRLAGAKLLARCSHLLLALFSVDWLRWFLYLWLARSYGSEKVADLSVLETIVLSAVGSVAGAFVLGAFAAAGLYFAARFRSLVGALAAAYLSLLLVDQTENFAWQQFYKLFSVGTVHEIIYVHMYMVGLQLLLYLVVLRFFLMGAAKHLALRRGE